MYSYRFLKIAIVAVFCLQTLQFANAIDVGTTDSYHNHRFEYWGTSLAWWANEVGGQSNVQGREDLVDIFFDPNNGLGMNSVRYNIGAGSNPDTSIQNITRPGAVMDGWVPDQPSNFSDTSTWVWDWNADATQRLILDMSIEHGVTTIEAFANSAPWWLTRNEKSNGTTSNGGSNLSTARDDEFAYYMLEVVDHFHDNLGIQFDTLAPMNEPGSGFWNGNSNQEGMGVPAGFYQDQLIKEFGSSIEQRGTDIKLVGLEETSTDQSADSWLNGDLTDTAKSYIKQFNTHTYGFNGASLQSDSERLFDAVNADGLKIYATEYGTGQGAVRLATQINRDIRYLDAAGWTYWQALEDNNGSGWGLTIANFNGSNNTFDVQDQYFAFKQFSSYIRPGSEIIELDNQENITAAYDPRTGKTVLVITNDGDDNTSEQYSFDLLDRNIESTRLIRTTDENNDLRTDAYAALGPGTVSGNNVTFDTVGNAITSIVISHRPNLVSNGNLDGNGLPDNSPVFSGWENEGDIVFDTGADNSGDSTGSIQLQTNSAGNSGKIYQRGIGDADTDLTGVAFQIAADVQFRNDGSSEYDADTFLGLEFYGADDEVLTSVSLTEYETEIEPAFAVKRNGFNSSVDGSDPNDSVYRTYLSGRFVAPEGTRYVRPVVRYDSVQSSSNSVTSVDNIELIEVHPEASAREWNIEIGGSWENNDHWLNNASVEKNDSPYFGNAIASDSIVTLDTTVTIEEMTFFSDHEYHLQGSGQLLIGDIFAGKEGRFDARVGEHTVSVATQINGIAKMQILPDAKITFDSSFDVGGWFLTKLGAGTVDFATGFVMNNGTISSYLTQDATIEFGSDAVLNGSLILTAAPGQELEAGDVFEIASYNAMSDTFDNIFLPSLSGDLSWSINYGANALTVSVLGAALSGDFNNDGMVDAADYTVWRDNLGASDEVALNGAGDGLNGVDSADYLLWVANYGTTSSSSTSTTVPEPAGLTILVAAMVLFFGLSRHNKFASAN